MNQPMRDSRKRRVRPSESWWQRRLQTITTGSADGLWRVGARTTAKRILEKASPNNPQARGMLAELLTAAGNPDEAESLFLSQAREGSPGAALQLADLLYERNASRVEIEKWYRAAVKEEDAGALNNLGCFLSDDDERLDEAEELLMRAWKSGDHLAPGNIGRMAMDKGEPQAAVPWFEKSINLGVLSVLPLAAKAYAEVGNFGEANRLISLAIERDVTGSHLAHAEMLAGHVIDSDGDPEKWFISAIRRQESGAVFPYARWLHDQGRIDDAVQFYERAAVEGEVHAHLNLAVIFDDRGDIQAAESHLRTGMEGGDPVAAVSYARFLYDHDREPEIPAVIEAAERLNAPQDELMEMRDLLRPE
ncbi:tetratricopeptide repeat protein [Streptomyces sp. NPDC055078]